MDELDVGVVLILGHDPEVTGGDELGTSSHSWSVDDSEGDTGQSTQSLKNLSHE